MIRKPKNSVQFRLSRTIEFHAELQTTFLRSTDNVMCFGAEIVFLVKAFWRIVTLQIIYIILYLTDVNKHFKTVLMKSRLTWNSVIKTYCWFYQNFDSILACVERWVSLEKGWTRGSSKTTLTYCGLVKSHLIIFLKIVIQAVGFSWWILVSLSNGGVLTTPRTVKERPLTRLHTPKQPSNAWKNLFGLVYNGGFLTEDFSMSGKQNEMID